MEAEPLQSADSHGKTPNHAEIRSTTAHHTVTQTNPSYECGRYFERGPNGSLNELNRYTIEKLKSSSHAGIRFLSITIGSAGHDVGSGFVPAEHRWACIRFKK